MEGNVFRGGRIQHLCVAVEDGRIKAVKKSLSLRDAVHIDFGDKLILPAGIDIHVHLRDPGFTNKEDFSTGTMSAAFGGIGTVIDMPNTRPPTVSPHDALEKNNIASKKAYVDFGLNAVLLPDTDVSAVSSTRTISGFKLFLSSTTATDKLAFSDTSVLHRKLAEAGHVKFPICAHCEDERLFKKVGGKTSGRREHGFQEASDAEKYLAQRPPESESESVKTFLNNTISGQKAHICHVSSSQTVSVIAEHRKSHKNNAISCEVTPHHLFLTVKSGIPGGFGKVNPPLRTDDDRASLWKALNNGEIDIIASDHAPHTADEKRDFREAPAGIPGIETMYPLMLYQVKKGMIELARLVNAICEKPASLFGLNKGQIEPGMDADIIVIDQRSTKRIHFDMLHSRCGWTPYEKMEAMFPVFVTVRGETVIDNGELIGRKGWGRNVASTTSGKMGGLPETWNRYQ